MGTKPHDLDPEIKAIIRRKVLKLFGRDPFTHEDREDADQELSLRFWQRRKAYDHRRGRPEAYAEVLLTSIARSLVREIWAQKRGRMRSRGLNDEWSVSADRQTASDQIRADERLDLTAILEHLPRDLRELAEQLQFASVTEIARSGRKSRTGLYRQIRRLREALKTMVPDNRDESARHFARRPRR